MKIGLDVHGVLNENTDFFRRLCEMVQSDLTNEIHILSGPPTEQIIKELDAFGFRKGIHYSHVFSIVDFHREVKTPMRQDNDGQWWLVKEEDGKWVPDLYAWDKTKAEYCIKHKIDMMIDDSDAYAYFFKTPYARFYSKNKRKHFIQQGKIK